MKSSNWLSVPEMANDIGVSADKVRGWCAAGRIVGVLDIGDGLNRHYRASRETWGQFLISRTTRVSVTRQHRPKTKAGTNLLGI